LKCKLFAHCEVHELIRLATGNVSNGLMSMIPIV